MTQVIVAKGEKITCPTCKDVISTVRADIVAGTQLHAGRFLWVQKKPGTGETCTCTACGAPWAYAGRLHTEKGWRPE